MSEVEIVRTVLAYYAGDEVGPNKWVLYDVDIDRIAREIVVALDQTPNA